MLRALLLAVVALAARIYGATNGVADWQSGFAVRSGAGYRDNVTFAHASPYGSAFLDAGLDALVTRVAVDTPRLNFVLSGDHYQYLRHVSVEKEQTLVAKGEVRQFLGERTDGFLAAEYSYAHQVVDVSVTETNRTAVLAQGHTLTLRPGVTLDLSRRWWLTVETPLTRQVYAPPLDDYWQAAARVTLGTTFGRDELTLWWQPELRAHDRDSDVTPAGVAIAGTRRQAFDHDMRVRWRRDWDENARWQSTLQAGVRRSSDFAAGYFDYTRLGSWASVSYRSRSWTFTAEAGVAQYWYDVQTVSPTDLRHRERTVLTAGLRVERQLARWLRVTAGLEHERVLSNDRFETYDVNTLQGGLQWEF